MKDIQEMELPIHVIHTFRNSIIQHINCIVDTRIAIENGNWVICIEKDDNTKEKIIIIHEKSNDMEENRKSSFVDRKSSFFNRKSLNSNFKDVEPKDLIFFLHVIEKYSSLIDLNSIVNSTAKNLLMIGKTQSSKSSLFWCLVWIQLKILKKKPIVMCLNSKESKNAMIHKEMKDFNTLLSSFDILPLEVVSNFNNMNGNSIPILLGNSRQVKKLKSYIHQKKNDNHEFVVNVDEADLIFQDNDWENTSKKLQKDIKWLIDNNVPLWLITASPFAIWFCKFLESIQTFELKPKESYRSLQNKKIKVSFVDEKENMKNHQLLLKLYRERIIPHVEDLVENPLKYNAILYDSFHTKKEMLSFANFISIETQKNAYIVNRFNNKICVQQVSNGVMTSLKLSSIQDLFNHLEYENSGDYQHLIAGQFASRANTWRPSRHVGNGGLIAHINYCCNGGHMETNIQKQRATGEYNDIYPTQLQIMKQHDYYNLLRELDNIENLSIDLKIPCNPREKMEGKRIIHVGKHSRPAVDDSKYYEKRKEEYLEFDNKEDFFSFQLKKGPEKFHTQFMNEILDEISLESGFEFTNQNIRKRVLELHPNIDNLHVATTEERFHVLNDIYQRHFKKNYSTGRYTVGSVEDIQKLYLIRWKDNFTNHHYEKEEKPAYNDFFKHDVYFPYYATNGKIRVYKNDGCSTAKITF
jgi:hypothetical protein